LDTWGVSGAAFFGPGVDVAFLLNTETGDVFFSKAGGGGVGGGVTLIHSNDGVQGGEMFMQGNLSLGPVSLSVNSSTSDVINQSFSHSEGASVLDIDPNLGLRFSVSASFGKINDEPMLNIYSTYRSVESGFANFNRWMDSTLRSLSCPSP
jgi:hypothetical protein